MAPAGPENGGVRRTTGCCISSTELANAWPLVAVTRPSAAVILTSPCCDAMSRIQMTVDRRPTTPLSALRQGVSRRRSARVAASDQSVARPTMRRFNLYQALHSTSRRPTLKLPQPCVQPSRRTWLGCACPMSLPYTVVSHNQPICVLATPQGPVS
jgi:hypothetical protein